MKALCTGEKAATNADDKANIKRTISMYKQQLDEELAAINGGANPLEVAKEQFDKAKTVAEKNKLRLRIERLTMGASKDRTKSSQKEVEEALKYVAELEQEPSDGDGRYLMMATADNINDDMRIKAAKAKASKNIKQYKRLLDEGKTDEAMRYRAENAKWFATSSQLDSMSRIMNDNKKLLGKGQDHNIMKIIDTNRKSMLRAIAPLE